MTEVECTNCGMDFSNKAALENHQKKFCNDTYGGADGIEKRMEELRNQNTDDLDQFKVIKRKT